MCTRQPSPDEMQFFWDDEMINEEMFEQFIMGRTRSEDDGEQEEEEEDFTL